MPVTSHPPTPRFATFSTDGTSTTRKGMYALRGSGAQVVNLIDLTDSTQWPAMLTFGLAEGMYVVTQGQAGATYSTVSTTLNTAGVDGYALKVMVGDWVYWSDQVNGISRMLAPATFSAATLAAHLPPHQGRWPRRKASVRHLWPSGWH